MHESSSRTTCKPLFQELQILTLPSKYTLCLSTYWKLEIYEFHSTVHGINMRHKLKIHKPSTKLTMYQNGVYYSSSNIYNKNLQNYSQTRNAFNTLVKVFDWQRFFFIGRIPEHLIHTHNVRPDIFCLHKYITLLYFHLM